MPPNTIYVGRPTRWGNKYYPGCGLGFGHFDEQMRAVDWPLRTPADCVHHFREHMRLMECDQPEEFAELLAPPHGKDLACWCGQSDPCHADVLLELANR